jgi:hypothetical protein
LTHKLIRYGFLLFLPLLVACNLATAQDMTPTVAPDTIDNSWSAYVYNGIHDTLLRVSADGSQISYSLGFEDNMPAPYELSFNEDGSQFAYCKRESDPNTRMNTYTLIVRDVAAETNLLEVDLGAGVDKICTVGNHAFANNRVAVGLVNYSGDETLWQVLLIDATTGETVYQIDEDNNPVQLPESFQHYTIPLIRHLTETEVIFMLAPQGGGDGPRVFPAFSWNIDSDAIEAIDYWGLEGISVLDTGEVTFPTNDPALPVGDTMGISTNYNVVQVVDGAAPRNIYHTADWLIVRAQFINNGRQIAVLEYAAYDPNEPSASNVPTHWIAIDRAGNITELMTVEFMADIQPAPDGYVVLETTYPTGNFEQLHFVLRLVGNDVSTTLVELDTDDNSYWNLVWVTPTTTESNLAPFAALSQ